MSKKSSHVDVNKSSDTRDELVQIIADQLNKENKDTGKAAYFLDDKEDPSSIVDWVPTGSSLLDLAIGNAPDRGLPVGRIVTFTGLEGSGKSLFCAHLVANTQKKGGVAAYIDTEAASAPEFWKVLGVNLKDMLYVPKGTLEESFQTIESIVGMVRKSNKDRLCTIIMDSLAAASTKKEMESDYERKGYGTDKSLIIGEAMRKLTNLIARHRILLIFTNQLRMNLNAGLYGDKWIEPCGKATSFHSSVKVRLSVKEKLKNSEKDVIGTKIIANVTKNRMGPPFKKVTFDLFFDSGISDYASWLDFMKERNMLTGTKAKYKFKPSVSEPIELSQSEFVNKLNTEMEFKRQVYTDICNRYITVYKEPNSEVPEDVTSEPDDGKSGPEVEEV